MGRKPPPRRPPPLSLNVLWSRAPRGLHWSASRQEWPHVGMFPSLHHFSVDGNLGGLHLAAVTNTEAVNIPEHFLRKPCVLGFGGRACPAVLPRTCSDWWTHSGACALRVPTSGPCHLALGRLGSGVPRDSFNSRFLWCWPRCFFSCEGTCLPGAPPLLCVFPLSVYRTHAFWVRIIY